MEPRSGARYCHRIVHPFPDSIREFTSRTHKLLVCFRVFSDDWGVSASCVLRRISRQLNQVVSIVCFEVHPITTSQDAYGQGLGQFISLGRTMSFWFISSYARSRSRSDLSIFKAHGPPDPRISFSLGGRALFTPHSPTDYHRRCRSVTTAHLHSHDSNAYSGHYLAWSIIKSLLM